MFIEGFMQAEVGWSEWEGDRFVVRKKYRKELCVFVAQNCDLSTQNNTERIVNLSRFVSNRRKVERGNEGGKEGGKERGKMNAG